MPAVEFCPTLVRDDNGGLWAWSPVGGEATHIVVRQPGAPTGWLLALPWGVSSLAVTMVLGQWWIAWSDSTGRLGVAPVTLPASEQVPLPLAWPPVQPVVLPPVPPSLKGRALWLGYFFALSDRTAPGYGDNLTAPGNCTVVLTNAEAARSPWPYYAPLSVGEGPRKIATWHNVPHGQPWPEMRPTDVALYDGGMTLPAEPSPGITALECYSDPGESAASCEARLRMWLGRYPTAPVILVGQAYTRNGAETDMQKMADLQGVPLRLAASWPQVQGI